MDQVFISYSRKDKAIAVRLREDLEFRGISVWLDLQDILGGSKWAVEIEQAIIRCPYFLLLLSSHALASEYVRYEYTFALEREKRILPVILDSCVIPDVLGHIQYIDLADYQTGFEKLLKSFPADAFRKEASLAEIIKNVKASNKNVRLSTLLLIGNRRLGEAFEVVLEALSDPDHEIRATAAWTLDQLHDSRATDALVNAMFDVDFGVRSNAGWALVHLGEEIVPKLATALQHLRQNDDVREMAYQVLSRIGGPDAKKAIEQYLK
ncbi:MAG: toll/interleukin-1 receptor domain-containing protein [Anaerolineae bacterium]|nr:toll/interleukin-1 receptor domain-containing protein [Anaerolineae bacterium]